MTIYYNGFTDTFREYEGTKGYVYSGLEPRHKSNMSEELVKALPYYKVLSEFEIPKQEKSFSTEVIDNKDLLMEKFNALS